MTHQEAVDRANRVYNSSIREGLGVSEAFGAAFLEVERETENRCGHKLASSALMADSRRLQKIEAAAQDVVRVIEVWAERGLTDVSIDGIADALRRGLEDCGAGAVEPTSPSVEGR